ncbi:hypothetical protein [Sulfuricurvum sp.]|uniref:beta strand repeat-containing protein n=1 Tax=Sulfuricurvum sp. TaxID=2025608 RepID=UPI00261448BE|nr:hypothetical protein [Sulfuricurvum sp.]MDD2267896.1 hypothetical protein [Sulfuricurvum sp.]
MALLTFKGTTAQALAAITATDIGLDTKVTITDADYTAANLNTINTATDLPIVLLKTAASQALSDTAVNIATALDGITNYTGAIIVTGANPTAAELNTIAKSTTGKVTATLDVATTIDSTTVTALNGVKATDSITFVPTDAIVSGTSELTALINLKKLLPNADFSAVTTLEGTSENVAAIKSALNIATDADVTITAGQISAVDANAIAKATDGALTATIKDGSVAATLKALVNVDATDDITFTTTDKSVNARDLVALNDKIQTPANFTVTSITTITENAATVGVAAVNVTDALAIADVAVKITGTISATTADLIAGAAAETVTATIAAGTASTLVSALGNATSTDALTLTVNGGTAAAADLNALNALTSVAVNASAITEITATTVLSVTDLYAANTAKTVSGLGNEAIKITGAISATDANTIAKLTTSVVTATVTADAAATLVAALTDAKATDALTLAVTATPAAAADLKALDGKTSVAVDASLVTLITGNAADVKTVLAASGIDTAATVPVTVSGTVSAADANTITGATSGKVTAEVAAGTAAALNKALTNAAATDDLTLTISKGTAAATDLIDLDDKTNLAVNANAVTTITGSAADVKTVLAAAGIDTALDVAATVSDTTVSVTDANTIAAATTGKVTATIVAGTAADLNGLADGLQVNAYTLTVNGATAAATVLNSLDAKTSVKVKVDALAVTGDYADLETLYVTNKAGFANLGNEAVTITGTPLASQVNTIAKATTGIVTAAATATADVLVANLKDANATDALTLTVTGADAKASDLNTLDGKTSVDVVVNATNVTGNIADLTKLYVTNVANFTAALGDETVTISGTVTAAQADAIADVTTGAVTANIAAGTAAALNTALVDANAGANAYTLTVNGTTAAATDLNALDGKTSVAIKVDAKEITGIQADLATLLVTNKAHFTGEETKAVKITDTVAANLVNDIAVATTGVVTATVTAGTAAALNTALAAAKATDALTLAVTAAPAAATDLIALDGKTSVNVNANLVTEITGNAADIKTVLAAKTITKAADVDATVDGVISAADANTISKATTGTVTATVDAGTAAALKSALAGVANDGLDALTLTVTGTTAAAADLIALDAKTSVDVVVNATTVTGNIVDVTKVLVTDAANFTGEDAKAVTISGTVSATDADAIADVTTGAVTATITAGTAAALNTALVDANAGANAYKLTVSNDTTTLATNLTGLDAKTSVAVDAHLVTDISGSSAEVAAAYATPTTGITGLGNETVHITGTDATVANVAAINTATTGVITLGTLDTTAGNFSLSQLGDLKGITGLDTIDTTGVNTDMTISLKDLLASNDSVNSIAFTIVGDVNDSISFTDTTGWTLTSGGNTAADHSAYTNNTTSQVITITHTDIVINA